jgi:hypothetical protein
MSIKTKKRGRKKIRKLIRKNKRILFAILHDIPCKNCIVLPMCKSRFIEKCREELENNKPLNHILDYNLVSIISVLSQCQLLEDHFYGKYKNYNLHVNTMHNLIFMFMTGKNRRKDGSKIITVEAERRIKVNKKESY